MSYKVPVLVAVLTVFCYCAADVFVPTVRDAAGPVVVHATNNVTVPSIDYVVNAIQCLKQSIDIFPDEAGTAKVYSALFKTKYPDHVWNVAVGYSTLYINSSIFIEASVVSGGQKTKKDKSKSGGNLYMIFSSD